MSARARVLKAGVGDPVDVVAPAHVFRGVPAPPRPTADDVAAAYERGVVDGRARAAAEHDAGVAELRDGITRLVAETHRTVDAAVEELRRQVVDLGLEVGRWLAVEEIVADPERFRARLAAAMHHVAGDADVRVVVHPDHADRVATWVGDDCTVVADDTFGPADLVVRTNAGTVVGTLDDALDRLRLAFEEPGDA